MITFKQFLTEEFLLEASSGQGKWDKYFGNVDVETIAKNDSKLYDVFGNSVDKEIKKGDPLTVLAADYDTKPRIRIGNGEYRMKFSDIDKPFKINLAVRGNLKPDVLKITGKIKLSDLNKRIKKAIDADHGIPNAQGEYLKALVDLAEDMDDGDFIDTVKDLFESSGVKEDKALQNTINNDFMECLGPFFVADEMSEYKNSDVVFPTSGSEPLYDFEMIIKDPTQFSSKRSGGHSNTLKAAQVFTAASKDAKLKKKYSKELELLKIITDNSVRNAPGLINTWLAENFKDYKIAPAPTDNTAIARLEAAVVKFITRESKMNFVPLVKEAIPDLWYVKSKLKSDGTIKVEPLKNGRDIDKTELRSKSSPGHLADKLGFVV